MVKIVFTDLDGTFLDDNQSVSKRNYLIFELLGEKKVTRVAATGRSLKMVKQVISPDFPFDYVIFSSGAGVVNWKTKEIIFQRHLNAQQVNEIASRLTQNNINYMIQAPIPDNHKFVYYSNGIEANDFSFRIKKWRDWCRPILEAEIFAKATQFLLILEDTTEFEQIKKMFSGIKVIRATSPFDGKSIWMELFHEDVSKGKTARWLCEHTGINPLQSLAIGNDYNDLELLYFTTISYLVENSPSELKSEFKITESNNNNGVASAICKELNLNF